MPTLERLMNAGHEVLCVVTQPDRPRGRGQDLGASPVKQMAISRSLTVYQPERIKRPEAQQYLAALHPELMVVVGYGQIIPQAVIDIAPRGIINVHASLLPKYRGAAPVQWAIVRGENRTGVTTMQINAGLDTGDMLLRAETEISPEETAVEVGERLSRMGGDLAVETLDALARGAIVPEKQDEALATYAPILKKEDGRIDWGLSAVEIHNRVRGLVPWPGAFTQFRGQTLHVWKARPCAAHVSEAPGRIFRRQQSVCVACGSGAALELLEVQMAGRKRVSAEAFANGQRLTEGDFLGDRQN